MKALQRSLLCALALPAVAVAVAAALFATLAALAPPALAQDFPASTITFGAWGVKSPGHLYGELLAQSAGVKIRHIAFDGGSKAMLSALGGHVDLGWRANEGESRGDAHQARDAAHFERCSVRCAQRIPIRGIGRVE